MNTRYKNQVYYRKSEVSMCCGKTRAARKGSRVQWGQKMLFITTGARTMIGNTTSEQSFEGGEAIWREACRKSVQTEGTASAKSLRQVHI